MHCKKYTNMGWSVVDYVKNGITGIPVLAAKTAAII